MNVGFSRSAYIELLQFGLASAAKLVRATEGVVAAIAVQGPAPNLQFVHHLRGGKTPSNAQRARAFAAFKDYLLRCVEAEKSKYFQVSDSIKEGAQQFCVVALQHRRPPTFGFALVCRCKDTDSAVANLAKVQKVVDELRIP